ncbi:hypothetical protein N656DRAFT_777012 [Canariomyces notabilis]|uniref:Uncharacterized protein n=1 Tax=Canariomyces notabilis TaxID=2074819 RepID=A0AAN6YVA4_9PEZI|nr:hypothetical protein N656DRAFT_777012 [Canariomyces arenarius]
MWTCVLRLSNHARSAAPAYQAARWFDAPCISLVCWFGWTLLTAGGNAHSRQFPAARNALRHMDIDCNHAVS